MPPDKGRSQDRPLPIASTARRRLARWPAGTGCRAAPVRLSPASPTPRGERDAIIRWRGKPDLIVSDHGNSREPSPQRAIGCATPTICGRPLGKLFLWATSLWRLRSYVWPVDARPKPAGHDAIRFVRLLISSARSKRWSGYGMSGSAVRRGPSPHCALAKLQRRLRRDALINRSTAPRAGTVRRSS